MNAALSSPHRPASSLALAALLTTASTGGAVAGVDLSGTWARGDGGAVVRIDRCGDAWCAENIWVAPDRRAKEAVGDVLEMRVRPESAKRLAGTGWDRRRAASYRLTIDVARDRLATRGCVLLGLVCIDMTFDRVSGAAVLR